MPDFMILIHEDDAEQQRLAPAETRRLLEAHAAFAGNLKETGAWRDGERLRPVAEGRRVRVGKPPLAGPFPGEKALAGYYVVRADDLAAAVSLAEQCPMAPGDTLDVRPL